MLAVEEGMYAAQLRIAEVEEAAPILLPSLKPSEAASHSMGGLVSGEVAAVRARVGYKMGSYTDARAQVVTPSAIDLPRLGAGTALLLYTV